MHPEQPYLVPELVEGKPTTKPAQGSAAEFLVGYVRDQPGEASIWAEGSMTNLALAARLDPQFSQLARELFFAGESFNPVPADKHFAQEYHPKIRQEFNLRWAPEAASLLPNSPSDRGRGHHAAE